MADEDASKQINRITHGDKQLWHMISKELQFKPNPTHNRKLQLQGEVIHYYKTQKYQYAAPSTSQLAQP